MSKLTLAKTNDILTSEKPKYAVIMIHGIASNSASYDKAIDYLTKEKKLEDLRIITFDLLGAGKSLTSDELNYDYKDHLTALENAISELELEIPIILVGHSMGTFIATRYASKHKKDIKKLILISPPIYTKEDLENPAMAVAIDAFSKAVSARDPEISKTKAFNNEIKYIVLNPDNYKYLAEVDVPTTLVYGELDRIIASFNLPKILKINKNLSAEKAAGGHGVTIDKLPKLRKIIAGVLAEE
ncbi:alpha/beta fold hydrolase [Candidatus Saccharibacteria bacterium]|nr:alpha/beta fold hydrolase [Candidatus Saccharibacteria bacterium]